MKKIMYAIGLLTSMSITLGWLFKYLNWKGGGDLFTYGMIGFLLVFLPMLAITKYKIALLKNPLIDFLGFSGAYIVGIGILLRTSDMQYGSLLAILGTILISFGFLPCLFFRLYHKSVEQN